MRSISGLWGEGDNFDAPDDSPGAWRDSKHRISLLHHPKWAQFATSQRTSLVADLRVDNRRELIEQLRISAHSDSEVMLSLWERCGLEAFERIEGEFAVAIFDRESARLTLAVDALGQRALHYAVAKGAFAFASTPVALARWQGAIAPNFTKLASRLVSLGNVGPESLLKGVQRVRPGHVVHAESPGQFRERRWWKPDLSPLGLGFEEAVEAVRSELRHAVRTGVRRDHPVVATQLSGGLDSSAVTSVAAEVLQGDQSLVAFTGEPVGRVEYADHPDWFPDEAEYAAETARMLPRIRHVRVNVPPASPFKGMDQWFAAAQFPLTNVCNWGWVDATYAAAAEAGARQMLIGLFGNSTFSHDGHLLLRECLLHGRWRSFASELAERRKRGARWRGIAFMTARAAAPQLVDRLFSPVHGKSLAQAHRSLLLRPGNPHLRRAAQARRVHDRDVLRLYSPAQSIAAERLAGIQSITLTGDPLAARALHGLELLDPTASRRLVELCLRLPERHFNRDGDRRSLARALIRGKAPDRVVNEQRKGCQGGNWRAGFEMARAEIEAEVEAIDEQSELADLLDVAKMRAVIRAWPDDNWNDPDQEQLYRSTLMRAIGVARFARWLSEGAPGAD